MQVTSYTQARNTLNAVIDQVIATHEPALIRRRKGGNVVLLPQQTYNSMRETLHLLSTTANAQRLLSSVEQLNGDTANTRNIYRWADPFTKSRRK